jgi:hypothetical protein
VENAMLDENTDRLRARISELENDLSNKITSKSADMSGTGSSSKGGGSSSSSDQLNRLDESSEERAEVMHGLLKELRTELIHKEEVCFCISMYVYLYAT